MRIIGGELRGKRLFSVKGKLVRPTTDRHRESIFNILSSKIQGANVLDLFAGTGALGLEALSRGAELAVFVDNFHGAIDVMNRNIRSCRLESRSAVVRCNILKNLNAIGIYKFNLVFMDPPYESGFVLPAMENLIQCGSLKPDSILVAEHSGQEKIMENPPGYQMFDRRKFGKTLVSFFKHMI